MNRTANSVESDEMAHYNPSNLNLYTRFAKGSVVVCRAERVKQNREQNLTVFLMFLFHLISVITIVLFSFDISWHRLFFFLCIGKTVVYNYDLSYVTPFIFVK